MVDDKPSTKSHGTLVMLALCIYGSFLTWAILQEKVTTTPYGRDGVVFHASHILNIVQSLIACICGLIFLQYQRFSGNKRAQQPLIPNLEVLKKYLFVAACQAVSSPFAYSSLQYVDYLTMLLAKSCKLVPVMVVSILVYRKTYPAYKYAVVGVITAGVVLFSLKKGSQSQATNQTWGMVLLGINLFLDGLYNTSQDDMFKRYKGITGQHMMCVMNFLTFVITVGLFLWSEQIDNALWFARHHPIVYRDVLLFGLCGALGQVFIFITLAEFGSLTLVTITITRKMVSMLLSVFMFGHTLSGQQWGGVLLVFGGIVAEALRK